MSEEEAAEWAASAALLLDGQLEEGGGDVDEAAGVDLVEVSPS